MMSYFKSTVESSVPVKERFKISPLIKLINKIQYVQTNTSLPNPFHSTYRFAVHMVGRVCVSVIHKPADAGQLVYHTYPASKCWLGAARDDSEILYSTLNTEIRLPRMRAKYFRFQSKTNSA